MNIKWYSKKAEVDYVLKPEDYSCWTRGGPIIVRHKSGQYVGEVVNFDNNTWKVTHYDLVPSDPVLNSKWRGA